MTLICFLIFHPFQTQAAIEPKQSMLKEATVAILRKMQITDVLRITQHLPVVAQGEKQHTLTLGTCGAGAESAFDVLKDVQQAATRELNLDIPALEHTWHVLYSRVRSKTLPSLLQGR